MIDYLPSPGLSLAVFLVELLKMLGLWRGR